MGMMAKIKNKKGGKKNKKAAYDDEEDAAAILAQLDAEANPPENDPAPVEDG
jgi:hypothetical protein